MMWNCDIGGDIGRTLADLGERRFACVGEIVLTPAGVRVEGVPEELGADDVVSGILRQLVSSCRAVARQAGKGIGAGRKDGSLRDCRVAAELARCLGDAESAAVADAARAAVAAAF